MYIVTRITLNSNATLGAFADLDEARGVASDAAGTPGDLIEISWNGRTVELIRCVTLHDVSILDFPK